MMSEAVGGSVKVSGKSMPIATSGVIPGSTPISVPSATPAKQYRRFSNETATANPRRRFSNKIEPPPELERQLQDVHEYAHAQTRHDDSQDEDFLEAELASAERGDEEHRDERGHQSRARHENAEDEHRGDDAGHRPPFPFHGVPGSGP